MSKRRLPTSETDADVGDDPAFICSSAVSLSTSALFSALMLRLEENGIMSAENKRAVYKRALELLETDPADDGA